MLLLAMVSLASCNGDYAQPPLVLPEGGIGNGTWDSPLSAVQVLGGTSGTNVWVTGYIVGWIDTDGGNNNVCNETTCTFTVPATLNTNMLMAATPDERDYTKCIPVQLGGDVRNALNLQDHPENLGKQVTVKGNVERYFSINEALKTLTAYNWGDKGIEEQGGDTPSGFDITVLSAKFDNGAADGFTFDQGELPSGLNFVWSATAQYGLKASGYYNNTHYTTDAWAISPEVTLVGLSDAVLTFRWAGNYFNDTATMKQMTGVAVREAGGEWIALEVPTWPAGSSWTFVDSGTVSLKDYCGKKIQIGFHYTSTSSVGGTLEVDDIMVMGAK